jgi:hypothetical protein
VFRRMLGRRWNEVIGGWRKLHNEELHNLYSSPSIRRIIKSRTIRWIEHVERMARYQDILNDWPYPVLGERNRGTWPFRLVQSKKIETIKYVHDSCGTETRGRLRWRGPSTIENYRPNLSLERAPLINKSFNCLKIIIEQ